MKIATCTHCGNEIKQLDSGLWVLSTADVGGPPIEWIASFPCHSNRIPCPSIGEPVGHRDCRKCEGEGDIPSQHEPAT